jgi:hypothetical protein
VIYFDDLVAEREANLVVLDPTYVADKFEKVLYRFDLRDEPPPPKGQPLERWQRWWSLVRKSGRLHEGLLSGVWDDFATRGRTTLHLLQRLDLLCSLPDPPPAPPTSNAKADPGPWYFVPAVPLYFNTARGGGGQLPPLTVDRCFAALDFDHFLPHGWFSRLLLHGTRHGLWAVGELHGCPGSMDHVAVVKLHARRAAEIVQVGKDGETPAPATATATATDAPEGKTAAEELPPASRFFRVVLTAFPDANHILLGLHPEDAQPPQGPCTDDVVTAGLATWDVALDLAGDWYQGAPPPILQLPCREDGALVPLVEVARLAGSGEPLETADGTNYVDLRQFAVWIEASRRKRGTPGGGPSAPEAERSSVWDREEPGSPTGMVT